MLAACGMSALSASATVVPKLDRQLSANLDQSGRGTEGQLRVDGGFGT